MEYRHACVIDENGYYVACVRVEMHINSHGKIEENIAGYTLKNGGTLLDKQYPSVPLVRPKWDRVDWTEGATAEEIVAYKAAQAALFG